MTTIKTLVRVLQRNNIGEREREEYLQTIAAECDRQIEFVQTLLDLSRIESGAYKVSFAETDVREVLEACVHAQQRAAASRGLNLILETPGKRLPQISTDGGVLARVVSNLIENAMKYTPEGGTIAVAAFRRNNTIVVTVTDNGFGISGEDLPRIFERFYRGRPLDGGEDHVSPNETPGTGLGLYLTKNLVEQLQGEIYAESPARKNDQGTRFTVVLPVKANGGK